MTDRLVQELETEARYHRERLALYRARAYSVQPTSARRLRELERTSDLADRRVHHAKRQVPTQPAHTPDPHPGEAS